MGPLATPLRAREAPEPSSLPPPGGCSALPRGLPPSPPPTYFPEGVEGAADGREGHEEDGGGIQVVIIEGPQHHAEGLEDVEGVQHLQGGREGPSGERGRLLGAGLRRAAAGLCSPPPANLLP